MSAPIKWLLFGTILIVAVITVVLWVRTRTRPDTVGTLTGTVPADQSLPFSAETVLAGKDRPEYTVFEFEVNSGDNPQVDLTSFILSSKEEQNALAGDFSFQTAEADSTMLSCTNTSQSVTIDFTRRPEGKLTVRKDSPATCVVLALPRAYSGLSVTFTGTPIGTRTLKLDYRDGVPITFPALKRHRIYGLSLPSETNDHQTN